MPVRPPVPRGRAALFPLLLLAACGGGGGGTTSVPGTPPASLAYAEPDVRYRIGDVVTADTPSFTGGAPTSYSVAPPLPTGLVVDPTSGTLFGAPTSAAPPKDYVVTGANASGQAQAVVRVEVRYPVAKSLAPAEGLTDADLRHFLRRTHWGVRQASYDALVGAGLPAYVDAMLAFPAVGSTPQEQQAAALLARPTDPPGEEGKFPTLRQLSQWWLYLMLTNPDTFQEVLGFFWHDHFATSSDVLANGSTWWMKDHVDLLRGSGAGNLRDLLIAVSRDRAMLMWLNGLENTKRAPNENYGREFYELFALGVDNGYTQDDIVQTSKAFTGYRTVVVDANTGLLDVAFDTSRHDPGDKTVFGVTIPGQNTTDDYAAVVDLTLSQRDVAGWIALSLLRYFCMDAPAPELVDQLAKVLKDGGWELAPALRALFLSEAFYSPEGKAGLVKGPTEMAVGFINSTGLVMPLDQLEYRLDRLGQVPTRPPNVNGWPGGPQWLSAQGMVDRANLLRTCIVNRSLQQTLGIDVATLLPPGTPTSAEVVDALAQRLGVTPTPEQHDLYVEYLDTDRLADGTIVPSPFDPTNPTHVDDRVRGLLYVLGQNPGFELR